MTQMSTESMQTTQMRGVCWGVGVGLLGSTGRMGPVQRLPPFMLEMGAQAGKVLNVSRNNVTLLECATKAHLWGP